jgi:DNA-binding NtrC family response regulator
MRAPGGAGEILSLHLDSPVRVSREELLKHAGYSITSVSNPAEAEVALSQRKFYLLLLGHDVSKAERHRLAAAAKATQPHIRVLVLHASGNGPGSFADGAIDSRDSVEAVMSRIQEFMHAARRNDVSQGLASTIGS